MINVESLIQLKAFARQDGALLSLLFMASFACLVYAPSQPWANILVLSVPVFIGFRLVKFRNFALNGVISLRRGYAYSFYTYLYASIIFALAQYLYFAFLDKGTFVSMLISTINILAPAYYNTGITQEMLNENISVITSMTPIQWAFLFLIQNTIIAFVVALPIAAICSRRGGKTTKANQRNNK